MAKGTALEAELASLMEEFVARIVGTLRNASFADVAALAPTRSEALIEVPRPRRAPPALTKGAKGTGVRRARTTSSDRSEMAERVAGALRKAGGPLAVSALASALGVPADRLAAPLKDLRVAGRVKKHGDKRTTTYSAT